MQKQVWSEKELLENWISNNTTHIDFVASWEELLNIYDVLRFTEDLSDQNRMEEFKWIIAEMNKFLTRMNTSMNGASDIISVIKVLQKHMNSQQPQNINTRKSLAYNKLKQRWVVQSINEMKQLWKSLYDEPEGEEEDG